MELIDGKKISDQIKEEIAVEVHSIKEQGGKIPHLAAILVGHDGGSVVFEGPPAALAKAKGSLTGEFLAKRAGKSA